MKKIFLTALLAGMINHLPAQIWQPLGSPSFTSPTPQNSSTSLAMDHHGVLYVAYSDASDSSKISVMKFDSTSQVNVGTFSAKGYAVSLAINLNNVPYVSFCDSGYSRRVTVKKFDGNNWIDVGVPGFSDSYAWQTILRIGTDDTAYVAYIDAVHGGGFSVKKFDGINWVDVGGSYSGWNNELTMALDANNLPYIVAKEQSPGVLRAYKFNGSSWSQDGPQFASTNSKFR